MTIFVIALQFLVVFAVNVYFINKLMKTGGFAAVGWTVLGGSISAIVAVLSCVFADELGVSIFSSFLTVGIGFVAGIAAVIVWDVVLGRAFKNLHQLT
ncbi:MAG: hypothetical protein K2X77_26290 [Candidatus Obscuribacterales bacterium]|jgi:hypothetical protein|nr:hypothetical protein [Candidatus Obscuribacterales bacterium]